MVCPVLFQNPSPQNFRLPCKARWVALCCFKITLPRIFGCNAAVAEHGMVQHGVVVGRPVGYQIPVGLRGKSPDLPHAT